MILLEDMKILRFSGNVGWFCGTLNYETWKDKKKLQ